MTTDSLKIFNTLNYDRPWSEDYSKKFMTAYKAWAASFTKIINEKLDESELRQSVKCIKLYTFVNDDLILPKIDIVNKPGIKAVKGLGFWEEYTEYPEKPRELAITQASGVKLGKVTPKNMKKMANSVVKNLLRDETEAINILKDAADVDNVILYIRKPYIAIDDPTLIKQAKIGFFGWEEIAVTTTK